MAHSQRNMDDVGKSAIELVLTTNQDDPFPILKELLDRHIINDEQFSAFLQADHANREAHLWINLSEHLRRHCTIFTLICILLKIGQTELAQRIADLVEHNRCEQRIARVYRVQTDKQKSIRLFFKNLKSQVHDATLKNPREALRCLAERYYRKLNCESNASRQYYFADKLVAILGVEIDAHAITFNDKLSSHALFDELKALVPASSNTMMTDVSYYGRLANANAIGGRFDEGQNMLVKAQYSAAPFTSCLEVTNMYYIQVYFLLWEFEATRSPQLKHILLETAEKGIASLQDEDDDIRVLWTRMFLLRMIFCLLGIGNRANILQGFLPSSQDIAQAQRLLRRLRWEGIWIGIETRREMFYWVAMSRLNALQGKIVEAKSSAITAQKLAFSGKFKELTFITSCVEELERISSDISHEDRTPERNRHGDPETRPYTDSNIAYQLNNGLSADSNRTCDYDGLNSYAGQNCLSREYNRQTCCFDSRQMSNGKQFQDNVDDLMDTETELTGGELEHALCDQQVISYSIPLGHSNGVCSEWERSSRNNFSPYNSDSDETVFRCIYLHHKEDSSVYLFHHESVMQTHVGSDRQGMDPVTRAPDNSREVSIPFMDGNPYSSLDSELLFNSGEQELNSIVLFEDREGPEGDSMT